MGGAGSAISTSSFSSDSSEEDFVSFEVASEVICATFPVSSDELSSELSDDSDGAFFAAAFVTCFVEGSAFFEVAFEVIRATFPVSSSDEASSELSDDDTFFVAPFAVFATSPSSSSEESESLAVDFLTVLTMGLVVTAVAAALFLAAFTAEELSESEESPEDSEAEEVSFAVGFETLSVDDSSEDSSLSDFAGTTGLVTLAFFFVINFGVSPLLTLFQSVVAFFDTFFAPTIVLLFRGKKIEKGRRRKLLST